ncbi:MAG: FkbM family methyltransferase [bacterium]|nr:FkbM family methyltransferase [bacterium]
MAISKIKEFRGKEPSTHLGLIDDRFHRYKNQYPYFGYVDVSVFGTDFIMFSANDDLVAMTFFWHGRSSYEPMSMKLWQDAARKTQSILDVGSFSGVYSLLAATVNDSSRVLAIEASRRTYGRLLMNIFTNNLQGRIEARCFAASNGAKVESFKRFRGENILGIGDSLFEKHGLSVQSDDELVATMPLDALMEKEKISPGLIKIDVEGAEELVLEGMKRILAYARPKLLIEVTPKTSLIVKNILVELGYNVFMVDEVGMQLLALNDAVPKVMNLFAE